MSTKTHLVLEQKHLHYGLSVAGLLAITLAFFGLKDAYAQVGFDSSAGHVITIAIIIAVVTVASVLAYGLYLARKTVA